MSGNLSLGVGNEDHRTRINSCYMRELTHGNFLINCQRLLLMDTIGQGNYIQVLNLATNCHDSTLNTFL